MPRPLLLLLMLLVFAASVRGEADDGIETDDIPVVGRPVDLPFSEASGWFEVHARAKPTTLQAKTALTFTVSVRAVRPARRSPHRLDLRELPDFAERFYIEDSAEEVVRPDDRTWEFTYRLTPRRTNVTAIPSLPFVYFNPYQLTATKGFQVLYTDPIPLHVLPHETVQVPVQAPESAFVLTTGPEVLERQTPWTPPSIGTCVVLLLLPPFACIAWYLVWRRVYPDAARLASQRRSRAARRALQALHAARRLDTKMWAAGTTAIVADYLQQRLDLTIAEPTPREVELLFTQHGCSSTLTEQAVRFFEACDSARFLPMSESSSLPLHDAAVQLILAVEEETCPTLHS
ncbi:MAG TPA: hypothetical protein VMG10_36480 [Gemmataceae bacterium]|nr:hypothetical protein [Gemmataceae bacterium]